MRVSSTEASAANADRPSEPFRVSFVMPLYDKAPFIGRALRSALAQTHPALEVLVIDDGSRDDGPAITERYAAESPSIRLIRQANSGPSSARNRGIAEARGDWIAFLDADDVVLPRHLERAAAMARAHPSAGVLGAAYLETPEGEHERRLRELAESPDLGSARVVPFFESWIGQPAFFTSSVVVKRSDLLALGEAFPAGERLGEDLDTWFRLAERTPVVATQSVGALYTVGLATSLTGEHPVTQLLPAFQRLAQRCRSQDFDRTEAPGARRLVATHWLNVARARVLAGNHDGALSLALSPEVRARPFYWLRTLLLVLANRGRSRPLRLGGL